MGVVAAGRLRQRASLDRDLAVGLGREHQDDLGGVDVGDDLGQPLGRPFVGHRAVEALEQIDFALGVPAIPLPPLPSFDISGPSAVKRL